MEPVLYAFGQHGGEIQHVADIPDCKYLINVVELYSGVGVCGGYGFPQGAMLELKMRYNRH